MQRNSSVPGPGAYYNEINHRLGFNYSSKIKNTANIDALLKNYSISNINTNAKEGSIIVYVSTKNGEVIKKGETKKLIVIIKNNSKDKNIYYNFNINYLFEEYNL